MATVAKKKLSRKAKEELYNQIFRDDGTLRGTTFYEFTASGGRVYPMLKIQFDMSGPKPVIHAFYVRDNFYTKYAELVAKVAKYHGIEPDTVTYDDMMNSVNNYLRRYELTCDVVPVTIQKHKLAYRSKRKAGW